MTEIRAQLAVEIREARTSAGDLHRQKLDAKTTLAALEDATKRGVQQIQEAVTKAISEDVSAKITDVLERNFAELDAATKHCIEEVTTEVTSHIRQVTELLSRQIEIIGGDGATITLGELLARSHPRPDSGTAHVEQIAFGTLGSVANRVKT